jgi:hypothetical protein
MAQADLPAARRAHAAARPSRIEDRRFGGERNALVLDGKTGMPG